MAAALAATAVLAAPAHAGPPAGTRQCPPGEGGIVVWAWSPKTGTNEDVVELCFYTGP